MKQEISAQNIQPELPSVRYEHNFETKPGIPNVELNAQERVETQNNKAEIASQISELNFTTVLPTPVVDTPVVDNATTYSSNPTVANDDDLIEKEWVEKAKKIVAETKDNPHQRDEEVNKLQVDYLKKRYGRSLGVTE